MWLGCRTFIIGFGAILFVSNNPQFLDVAKAAVTGKLELVGGNNIAAVHLSDAVGGDLFMGFISAVAFATIAFAASAVAVFQFAAVAFAAIASAAAAFAATAFATAAFAALQVKFLHMQFLQMQLLQM